MLREGGGSKFQIPWEHQVELSESLAVGAGENSGASAKGSAAVCTHPEPHLRDPGGIELGKSGRAVVLLFSLLLFK